MFFAPPTTPIVVKVIDEPTRELGIADILLGAVGLTGLLLIGSAILGLLLGSVFIWLRLRKPLNAFDGEADEPSRLKLNSPSR